MAAGTGHLSLAIAPPVRMVFTLDLTRPMPALAREETCRRSLENLSFAEGSAANLPYATDCFDLVLSRLVIHHFENQTAPLKEMLRVCRQDHRIGVIDLLSPEEIEIARVYNQLERLRDPSDTMALSGTQMENLLKEVGIAGE